MNYWIIPGIFTNFLNPNLQDIGIKIHPPDNKKVGRKKGVNDYECLKRHAVAYLLHDKAGWTYPKIADTLGVKDHSVVWEGARKFRGYLSVKDETAIALEREFKVKLFNCI